MKTKIKSKLNHNAILNKQDKDKCKNNEKLTDKFYLKKISHIPHKSLQGKISDKSKKVTKNIPKNSNSTINVEDSSTNCFSGNIKNNMIPRFEYKLINEKNKGNFIIPLLISKDSDDESLFINFKLGEKDTYTESTLRNDLKANNNNIKIPNNYDYCEVDDNIGLNENDSLEIYDFNDKTNVDYVLKNLSMLSYSKSGNEKSFILLDDYNEENTNRNKKMINKIKIFNTKQSISNMCSKINDNKINIKK